MNTLFAFLPKLIRPEKGNAAVIGTCNCVFEVKIDETSFIMFRFALS